VGEEGRKGGGVAGIAAGGRRSGKKGRGPL
jgi:hypothetical protein